MAKKGQKFLNYTNDERLEIVNLYNSKNIHLHNYLKCMEEYLQIQLECGHFNLIKEILLIQNEEKKKNLK